MVYSFYFRFSGKSLYYRIFLTHFFNFLFHISPDKSLGKHFMNIYLFIYLFGEWGMTYNCFNPNLVWEGIFVKKFDETSFWKIMASLSFFRFTNLQLSGSRIADACSVKLTFSHGNLSSYKNWKQNLNISNSALIL